jgi:hypothetical protein
MSRDKPKKDKSAKRPRQTLKEKRRAKAERKAESDLADKFSEGEALAADVSKQKLNPMGSNARLHYSDREFRCVDCGRKEIWRADAQKWWYEEAGGALESKVIICRECGIRRKREREDRRRQNEENRKKNIARKRKAAGHKEDTKT